MTSSSDSGSSGSESSFPFDKLVHPLTVEAGSPACDDDRHEASLATTETERGDGVSGLREEVTRGLADRVRSRDDRTDSEESLPEEEEKERASESGGTAEGERQPILFESILSVGN